MCSLQVNREYLISPLVDLHVLQASEFLERSLFVVHLIIYEEMQPLEPDTRLQKIPRDSRRHIRDRPVECECCPKVEVASYRNNLVPPRNPDITQEPEKMSRVLQAQHILSVVQVPCFDKNLPACLEESEDGILISGSGIDESPHSLPRKCSVLGDFHPWFLGGNVHAQDVLVNAVADFGLVLSDWLLRYHYVNGFSLRTGSARNGGARFVAFVGGNEMTDFLLIKLTCGASQLYCEMNSAFSIFLRNDLKSRIVYRDALSSRT
jgi:hypothetical protein